MSKRLRNTEVCADCSAPEPRWASVNRGVLICDECCSVHRSLGRHSSQVRHLTRMPWPPTQLQMVQTLYSNGANSIWEHSLLDPSSVMSGKRKPNPQDKLHPTKSEFIRAKYQMLAFVHRMPCREDDSSTAKDLSKQLHSSVRTGNLETCLRLLSLGAQANFFHPEKGNTPLHVAAREGQISQVELLSVYGADPGALDSNGKTPFDHAQEIGHFDLADRLVEIQYELTDRLAFYLYGRKPEHTNNDHFIVPQLADSSDLTELAKAAKRKLQSLSNHLFEELAMDVYDEVDRRETDAVWLATQNHSKLVTETTLVPFLPVNPEYSSTRNQGRQKLARFNAHEFVTLVIDILSDAKCRQQGSSAVSPKDNVELILNSTAVRHCSDSQDTDPDYDKVASDDDTDQELPSSKEERTKSLDSDLSDGPITMQEYVDVKNALSASEARIQELMKTQNDLNDQLRLMRIKLQSLQSENISLRRQVTTNMYQTPSGPDYPAPSSPSALKRRQSARASRPMSMYETGSGLKPYLPKGETPYPEEGLPTLQPFPPHTERAAFVTSSSLPSFPSTLSWSKDDGSQSSKLEKQISMPESDYDNTFNDFEMDDLGFCRRGRLRSGGWLGEGSSIPELDDLETESDPTLPSTEDVIRKTEQITKNIQELLRAAQDNKHDRSGPDEKSFFFLLSVFVFFVLHSFLQFQTQVHRYSVTISCFYALSISTFYSCQLHSSSCSIHPCSAVPFGFSVLPASRPCEREGVRRLRHSLGCFSTLVPWAEKAPSPLQPLSLRSPDPTSCFIPCSERIHVAVTEMAALFPKKPRSETVRNSLRLLTSSACRLQNECRKAVPSEGGSGPDTQLVTQQVIQCAYDIAKAAKQLVTITTKENTN
ncbi:ARF GTPase-activating protein GIT2a isoform X3 [Kryptolebias marmoratus]|uniref:ARF GTPase-activating protein GIT2a isoform X3 n=1 Tax=Kryptolebias marmoratus TaxID=37003 RepID=UPI0007F8FEB8|nr:ARF GTPase-activating protein GIT2a isoform X3 [Kryptolebias marmoratus]